MGKVNEAFGNEFIELVDSEGLDYVVTYYMSPDEIKKHDKELYGLVKDFRRCRDRIIKHVRRTYDPSFQQDE